MKIRRRLKKLRRTLREVQKQLSSKALILMYHRIAEEKVDPWELCVTPKNFAEHLDVLKNEARPVSLRQMSQAHKQGKIPDRSVVVTFDDGYVDNLYSAKPLLEKYDIPATVFVAGGHIGHEREYWWDELERIFLRPGTLPEKLTLRIDGKNLQWELGEYANYSEAEYQRYSDWTVDWQEGPTIRQSLYFSLHQLLQPLRETERNKVMDGLLAWADVNPVQRLTRRALSYDELILLKKGDSIEIGSHTMTHPFLSSLPKKIQQKEIRQSKILLEECIGQPVTSFAYPYGNYSPETVEIVREMGFDCACSTINENVWRRSNRFLLPRVGVENSDGEQFLKWLSQKLTENRIV